MLISGKMKYKKAVILTEEKMHELETLLHKYCDKVSYKAETINDSEIVFSSLDELLQYDNFESRSLKTLQITASGKSPYYIRLVLKQIAYSHPSPDMMRHFIVPMMLIR